MRQIDDLADPPSGNGSAPPRSGIRGGRFARWGPALAALAVLATAGAGLVAARYAGAGVTVARPAAQGQAGQDQAAQGQAAQGQAALPVGGPAPPVRSDRWLNTAALDPADLSGKVVLYDFWTFGCVNCQHTLPYLKAWYERYAADGLVVLGVHTPEFENEAVPANVADYVRREQITFPVALDPDNRNWEAFHNRYWPAFYLHDRQGRQRWTHIGEGDYDEAEDAIRALLGVDAGSPRARVG